MIRLTIADVVHSILGEGGVDGGTAIRIFDCLSLITIDNTLPIGKSQLTTTDSAERTMAEGLK